MIPAELDKIPVFVKEGGVVPMCEPALSTEEQKDAYDVKRFPGRERPYLLYTDAGDGYGYERGEYELKEI